MDPATKSPSVAERFPYPDYIIHERLDIFKWSREILNTAQNCRRFSTFTVIYFWECRWHIWCLWCMYLFLREPSATNPRYCNINLERPRVIQLDQSYTWLDAALPYCKTSVCRFLRASPRSYRCMHAYDIDNGIGPLFPAGSIPSSRLAWRDPYIQQALLSLLLPLRLLPLVCFVGLLWSALLLVSAG